MAKKKGDNNVVTKFGVDDSEFQKGLENAKKALNSTASSFSSAGSSILKGVAAVSGGILGLAKIGDTYDDAVDKLIIGTGKQGAALKALQGVFDDVYKHSTQSAGEVSNMLAMYDTKLNIGEETLRKLGITTTQLARMSDASADSIANNASSIANAWGVASEDVGSMLDKMYMAGQEKGIGISQLMSELSANTGAAKAFNLSLEDTIALLANFEAYGVDAGTAFAGLKKYFAGMAKEGLSAAETLDSVIAGIKNPSEIDVNGLAVDVFGSRGVTDMITAIRNGSFEYKEFAETLRNCETIIQRDADATYGFAEAFEELKHEALLAAAPMGLAAGSVIEKLKPAAVGALEKLSGTFEGIVGSINALTPQQLEGYANTFLNIAGAGAGLLAVGTAVKGISTALTFLSGPLGATTLAVAGLLYLANAAIQGVAKLKMEDKTISEGGKIKQTAKLETYDSDREKNTGLLKSALINKDMDEANKLIEVLGQVKGADGNVTDMTSELKQSLAKQGLVKLDEEGNLRTIMSMQRDQYDNKMKGAMNEQALLYEKDNSESGKSFVSTFASGITANQDEAAKAVLSMAEGMDELLPKSDAKKGPLSGLTKSGEAFALTFASGITKGSQSVIESTRRLLSMVGDYLPHSDAKKGPLSTLTASGRSIPKTIGEGIGQDKTLIKAIDKTFGVAGDLMYDKIEGPSSALLRVLPANWRNFRDISQTLWEDIAAIPGSALNNGLSDLPSISPGEPNAELLKEYQETLSGLSKLSKLDSPIEGNNEELLSKFVDTLKSTNQPLQALNAQLGELDLKIDSNLTNFEGMNNTLGVFNNNIGKTNLQLTTTEQEFEDLQAVNSKLLSTLPSVTSGAENLGDALDLVALKGDTVGNKLNSLLIPRVAEGFNEAEKAAENFSTELETTEGVAEETVEVVDNLSASLGTAGLSLNSFGEIAVGVAGELAIFNEEVESMEAAAGESTSKVGQIIQDMAGISGDALKNLKVDFDAIGAAAYKGIIGAVDNLTGFMGVKFSEMKVLNDESALNFMATWQNVSQNIAEGFGSAITNAAVGLINGGGLDSLQQVWSGFFNTALSTLKNFATQAVMESNIVKGALSGLSSILSNPITLGVGAVIGIGASIINSIKKKKAEKEAAQAAQIAEEQAARKTSLAGNEYYAGNSGNDTSSTVTPSASTVGNSTAYGVATGSTTLNVYITGNNFIDSDVEQVGRNFVSTLNAYGIGV